MQFIAEDPIHVVCQNETQPLHDTSGRLVRPGGRRLYAKFERGVAPRFAQEIGLRVFEFRKMPEGGVTAEQWLAYYDSVEAQQRHGWTDDERTVIEAKLKTLDGVLVVERPRQPAPWPSYDEIVASRGGLSSKQVVEKILATIDATGIAPAAVIAYELENRARKSIVAAIQELLPDDDDGGELEDELPAEELIEA